MKKKDLISVTKELITDNEVDIVVFAEYVSTAIEKTAADLSYVQHDGYGGCFKVTMIAKQSVGVNVVREQDRYTIYKIVCDNVEYNLVGLHLYDRMSHPNPYDRTIVAHTITKDIQEVEKASDNDKTIVIGDFNDNPFDPSMIAKSAFNAVLFRKLIDKAETCVYDGNRWKRFYNPILQFLRDEDGRRGSHYYESGSSPLYWNCFDQVLIRKALIDRFDHMEYITKTSNRTLVTNVRIKEQYSDHLPLLVCFR